MSSMSVIHYIVIELVYGSMKKEIEGPTTFMGEMSGRFFKAPDTLSGRLKSLMAALTTIPQT